VAGHSGGKEQLRVLDYLIGRASEYRWCMKILMINQNQVSITCGGCGDREELVLCDNALNSAISEVRVIYRSSVRLYRLHIRVLFMSHQPGRLLEFMSLNEFGTFASLVIEFTVAYNSRRGVNI